MCACVCVFNKLLINQATHHAPAPTNRNDKRIIFHRRALNILFIRTLGYNGRYFKRKANCAVAAKKFLITRLVAHKSVNRRRRKKKKRKRKRDSVFYSLFNEPPSPATAVRSLRVPHGKF